MEKSDKPESPSDANQLPLSVWLKGDEPYFSEFSLDAEEVMEQLGIKRSRLRQISGNELRVGRKRVERYIRPFYRPDDVEKYLNWTRATASHQKSSQMLNSAAEKLSAQSQSVMEQLNKTQEILSNQLLTGSLELKKSFGSMSTKQIQTENILKQYGSSLLSLARMQQEFFIKTMLPLMQKNQSGWEETKIKLNKLANINDAFLESIGLIQSNHQVLIQLQIELSDFKSSQENIKLKLEKLSKDLQEQQPKPLPKLHQPKRRVLPKPKDEPSNSRKPLLCRAKRRRKPKLF